jgi:hypothetical protein
MGEEGQGGADIGGTSSSLESGRSPLSAKLAAYGESLALERRLKREEEAAAAAAALEGDGPVRRVPQSRSVSGSRERLDSLGSMASSRVVRVLDRQSSWNQHSKIKRRERRRPNTSSGTVVDRCELFPLLFMLSPGVMYIFIIVISSTIWSSVHFSR